MSCRHGNWHCCDVCDEIDGAVRFNTEPLISENERLRAEVRDAYAAADSKAGWEWKKRAEQAEARAERLAEGLRKYGQHDDTCEMKTEWPFICTCGLNAALAQEDRNG